MDAPDALLLALELQENESDRYWSRSNILLFVQGALVAALSGMYDKFYFGLPLAMVGLCTSLLWLAVLVRGKLYVSRWGYVAEQIATRDVTLPIPPTFSLLSLYREAKLSEKNSRFFLFRQNTTTLMKWTVVVMMAFWMLVLFILVFDLWIGGSLLHPTPDVQKIEILEDPGRERRPCVFWCAP